MLAKGEIEHNGVNYCCFRFVIVQFCNIIATNRQRRFIYLFYDKCSVRSDAYSEMPQEFMQL